jgi:hypothetical protein
MVWKIYLAHFWCLESCVSYSICEVWPRGWRATRSVIMSGNALKWPVWRVAVDAISPTLHLSHAVPLRQIRWGMTNWRDDLWPRQLDRVKTSLSIAEIIHARNKTICKFLIPAGTVACWSSTSWHGQSTHDASKFAAIRKTWRQGFFRFYLESGVDLLSCMVLLLFFLQKSESFSVWRRT